MPPSQSLSEGSLTTWPQGPVRPAWPARSQSEATTASQYALRPAASIAR
jgi:hypothetical protein